MACRTPSVDKGRRSEEHTSELQSLRHLVCRLLLVKKKKPTAVQTPGSVARPVPIYPTRPPASARPPTDTITRPPAALNTVTQTDSGPFFLKDRAPTDNSLFPLTGALPI